jgi:hypothetical protein
MMDLPEKVRIPTTSGEIQRRLDALREGYRHGILSAAQFTTMAAQFRFADDVGHLWMPGATTSHWYRWDRTQWTQSEPPPALYLVNEQLETSAAWITTEPAAIPAPAKALPPAASLCVCGAPLTGTPFCKRCGKPAPAAASPAKSVDTALCSNQACGTALTAEQSFCPKCGSPAAKPASKPVCSNRACGCALEPGQSFCPKCGSPAALMS